MNSITRLLARTLSSGKLSFLGKTVSPLNFFQNYSLSPRYFTSNDNETVRNMKDLPNSLVLRNEYTLRPLERRDCPQAFQLILDMAKAVSLPSSMLKNTAKAFEEDAFDHKLFEGFAAVHNKTGELVGVSIYFSTYNSWEGSYIHTEKVIVKPEHRMKGIAVGMIQLISQVAMLRNCEAVTTLAQNTNSAALEVLDFIGAQDVTVKQGWHYMRLPKKEIETLIGMDLNE